MQRTWDYRILIADVTRGLLYGPEVIYVYCLIYSLKQLHVVGSVVIPILQMEKKVLGDTQLPALTSPDRQKIVARRRSQTQVCLAPKPMCLKYCAMWNEKHH